MQQTLTIHLEKPIISATIQDAFGSAPSDTVTDGNLDRHTMTDNSQVQNVAMSQACRTLNNIIKKLNQFYETIFTGHKEEIAKLSVEIARKILMQKVQEGDYEIESIIKEALKNAPTRKDVVVHVNPEDYVLCQKIQQDQPNGDLDGIKFISDLNIGRAECLLETPKGIIKSLIDEHLEQIANALKTAE